MGEADEIKPVSGSEMTAAHGVKVVGYFDCPGGGQVVVRDNVAYIGHIAPPHGTTIVDVAERAGAGKSTIANVDFVSLKLEM